MYTRATGGGIYAIKVLVRKWRATSREKCQQHQVHGCDAQETLTLMRMLNK